jgi:hypothetical protein
MLITFADGQGWRYEVIAQSDGYLVQARDLDSGEVASDEVTLFRTATTAFAFADLAAAADLCAAARLDDDPDTMLEKAFVVERRRFAEMRLRFSDDGIPGEVLALRRGTRRKAPTIH